MTTHLFDTTFLIDYLGGDDGVRKYLEATEEEPLYTTSLNVKEVAVGHRLTDTFDRASFATTFDWLEVVPFTTEHAVEASRFEAALHRDENVTRRGVDAAAADLLIAAVASVEGATIVTRNGDDVERFDVPVADY